MTDNSPRNGAAGSRVLLLGDASARPEGLERALARAGFVVAEGSVAAADGAPEGPPPDAVLITASASNAALEPLLAAAERTWGRAVPRVVALSAEDRDGTARALDLGADDALAAPIHLPELCARLARRVTTGRSSSGGPGGRLYDAMTGLVEDVCTSRRTDEVLHALVERLGRALELSQCSFVLTPPATDHGRVLAVSRGPATRDFRLDLARYPEIREAVRTAAPVVIGDVHTDPLFADARVRWAQESLTVPVHGVVALPVSVDGAVAGVLLLRSAHPALTLSPVEMAFADSVARACARLLQSGRGSVEGRQADPLTGWGATESLDDRMREEFERARRYALSFSLVLFDIGQLRSYDAAATGAAAGDAGTGDDVLADLGRLFRGGLRAPDFVCRYSGDEVAVVLPETAMPGARQSVNRVRERLGAYPFPNLPPNERPRLSAGIVTFPHPAAEQVGDLFALAEAALLRAKGQDGEPVATAESVAT